MTKIEKICRGVMLLGLAAFGILWLMDPELSADEVRNGLSKSVLYHLLGSIVFLALPAYLGYRLWHRPSWSCLAVLLPSLVVVVNNMPILALVTGTAQVERLDLMWLFAADCLLIGVFEELAFRGTLFVAILEKHRRTRKQIFWTTLISSAVFGLVHFANMLEGQGLVPTLMQVGYSFLIGGMCAIVFLKSGNILFPMLLHAVFDFGGKLLDTLGNGHVWNLPTIVITAVLGVAVTVWMLLMLYRITPEDIEKFYHKKEKITSDEHSKD